MVRPNPTEYWTSEILANWPNHLPNSSESTHFIKSKSHFNMNKYTVLKKTWDRSYIFYLDARVRVIIFSSPKILLKYNFIHFRFLAKLQKNWKIKKSIFFSTHVLKYFQKIHIFVCYHSKLIKHSNHKKNVKNTLFRK